MPVRVSILADSDLVHNDQTTNAIGRVATLVVDSSRLLAGVDPESFNGRFTFNEAIVGLSVQPTTTETLTMTNITFSGAATKLGVTYNVDAGEGEWTFVVPAGGWPAKNV